MNNYKNYLLRQLGIKESSIKPAGIQPSEVDPKELEMGIEDETEHTNDKALAQKIALQHLKQHPDYYSKIKNAGLEENVPTDLTSPTAIATPFIAMAVRGSSTGGLPSGADRTMSLPQVDGIDVTKMTSGQLGGYEPIPLAKDNSELINKTPVNPQINSSSPKNDSPQTQIDPHPFQFQRSQGEDPQSITGASTDSDDTLKLKMAMPKGLDIDIAEGEDEDNNSNNPEFQEKDAKQFRKDRSASPEGDSVRKHLGISEGDEADDTKGKCMDCGGKLDTDDEEHPVCYKCRSKNHPQHSSDFLNETFSRHIKLMNEGIKKLNSLKECNCNKCGKTCQCSNESCCECSDCGCGKANTTHDDKKTVEEQYSAPFSRMRGLANLGGRRLSSSGIWENVGAKEPFTTKWKMDKEKAGFVKVDEKKLISIKETLSKKPSLTDQESLVLQKINEVLKKRSGK